MNINAKQIEALDFNYLDQAETYQYMVDQLARAKASTPLMTKLGTEIGAWESSMQAFDVAFRRATTAGQTKVVETLDDGANKHNRHSEFLREDDVTNLLLDWRQMGVGCIDSWGAEPLPEHMLPFGEYSFHFVIRPI